VKHAAWGLTGGIASGKSTVGRLFEAEGFSWLDADQITRELSAPGGAAFDPIVKKFGTAERNALRELVFRDEKARVELEAILHPLIRQATDTLLKELPPPILYEASLLVETGRYRDFRGLITVSAPTDQRRARLVARSPESAKLAERIIAAQLTDADREAVADFVIRNDGTPDQLRIQVQAIARKIAATP
jgi:dephospho-CoA kinase